MNYIEDFDENVKLCILCNCMVPIKYVSSHINGSKHLKLLGTNKYELKQFDNNLKHYRKLNSNDVDELVIQNDIDEIKKLNEKNDEQDLIKIYYDNLLSIKK